MPAPWYGCLGKTKIVGAQVDIGNRTAVEAGKWFSLWVRERCPGAVKANSSLSLDDSQDFVEIQY